jgi:hypothetical protein
MLLYSSVGIVWGSDWDQQSLKTYGFFQNYFYHQTQRDATGPQQNSFSLQQLNLIFRRDFREDWTAFINFEVLNNFSSSNQWGAVNIQDGWVRYRWGKEFSLKMGLHLPPFNHLNEIKNRTPLLPYIIRPLVYESSFKEEIALEEFVPERAFVQAYGFVPMGKAKIEYALYLGNTSNVSTAKDGLNGDVTGIDTTSRVLVGGRLGVRWKEIKVGLSATHDSKNFPSLWADTLGVGIDEITKVPRVRLGGDISFNKWDWMGEAEFIRVRYDDDVDRLKLNKEFYYITVGRFVTEPLLIYGSYWYTKEHFLPLDKQQIKVPSIGASHALNDRVTLKAQYAYVEIKTYQTGFKETFHNYTVAISAFF